VRQVPAMDGARVKRSSPPYGAGTRGGGASNTRGDHGDNPPTLPLPSIPLFAFRAFRNPATAFCNAYSSSTGLYR